MSLRCKDSKRKGYKIGEYQMIENWKRVKANDNYEVSDKGRVRSYNYHSEGHILTPTKRGQTWLCVILCNNCKKKAYSISNLVYETFIGKLKNGYTLLHKDGDIYNNSVENLLPVKKIDKNFIKANKDSKPRKKNVYHRYNYFIITEDGNKTLIGGTSDLMKKYGIRTRQNVDQKFIMWEMRKIQNSSASSIGVSLGNDFVVRDKVEKQTQKELRIIQCETTYGVRLGGVEED